MSDRPNILLIMSDEHNASVTGCYGNDVVQTKALDGLAMTGVTFDAAYCNSPLCVPSRLSFTAGKYVSRIGGWNNDCWLESDEMLTLPRAMNNAGYESWLCGKQHYDATRRYGFKELPGSPTRLNSYFKGGHGARRDPDNTKSNAKGRDARFKDFYASDESWVFDHDSSLTDAACNYLGKREEGDKPFFLFCGYISPHFPIIAPESYWNLYKDKVPMPEIPQGHLDALPRNYTDLRRGFGVVETDAEIVKRGRELYYALTHWMDDQIGRLLSALGDSVDADNTIVIYTSDHGENMGEHGMWWKNCMYEHSARVPLIINYPKRWQGNVRRQQACSHVDLVQTIADAAGAKLADDADGQSMLPWLDVSGYAWKDFALSEYYAHNISSGFVMVRQGDYKYVYHTPADEDHPAERELYNLKDDPGEFNNLANDPEHAQLMESIHQRMLDELGEHPDETEQRCLADYAKGYGRDRDEVKGTRPSHVG